MVSACEASPVKIYEEIVYYVGPVAMKDTIVKSDAKENGEEGGEKRQTRYFTTR